MVKCPDCGKDWEKKNRSKSNRCAPCFRLWAKKWRADRKAQGNPVVSTKMSREYHQKYGKQYYKRPSVKSKKAAQARKRYRDPNHAQRIRARLDVRNALRRGDLLKEPCEICGKLKVQSHHDDYSESLKVRWLCRTHHTELHAKAKGVAP